MNREADPVVKKEKNDEPGVAGFSCLRSYFLNFMTIYSKEPAICGKGHNIPKFGYYLLIFF